MTFSLLSWFSRCMTPIRCESLSLPLATNKTCELSLDHYATPGGDPPPSARMHLKVKHQPRAPIRLRDLWRYGYAVISKAAEVTIEVLSFHVWGPRRKSWGIEMTVISAVMRGAVRYSPLVDLGTVRLIAGMAGLVPFPSDALVTPVSFQVRKLGLHGFLACLDSAETGSRELSGEWVVCRKTWQRLQHEWGTLHSSATATEPKRINKERVVYYIHGGAYFISSAACQRLVSIPLAKYTDSRVFAIDYRLAPESTFPGPLHDVVCGYMRLTRDLEIPAQNVVVCGDSAGGALTLALLMYLRDNCYPLPSGAIVMSPWVDLTMSCESWDTNALFDVVPFPAHDNHLNPIILYLGEGLEQYLTHPYASPLFGDCASLPPILLQCGDAEVLKDEIALFAHKAKSAGVDMHHETYEDGIHVFQLYPFLDISQRAYMSMRRFVQDILPRVQLGSPQPLNAVAKEGLASELVNDKSSVVRGDGVTTDAGVEGVKEKLGQAKEETEEEELWAETYGWESQRNFPSWRRSPLWPMSPTTSSVDLSLSVNFNKEDQKMKETKRSPTNPTNASGSKAASSSPKSFKKRPTYTLGNFLSCPPISTL